MLNNKKIIISLASVCLILLIIGSYKATAMTNSKKVISAPVAPVVDTTKQEETSKANTLDEVQNVASDINLDPNVKSEAKQNQSAVDKINDLIAKGKIIEAKEGYTYAQKKIIAIDKNLMVNLEGYRVLVDQSSYSTGNYYVIVDFSILNGKPSFHSSLSNFTLSDSHDYTYSPTLGANTRGDISGELKLGDFKRGEIAFYIPGSETQLELKFNTGSSTVRTVSFNFNTNSLINPPLPK